MSAPNKRTSLMSETTFYILLTLVEPLHGYAVMQEVEKLSQGTVLIGAGTLYGAFSTLEKDRLIEIVGEDQRRKFYQLTGKGKLALRDQINKLEIMVQNGQQILPELE